MHCGSAKPMRNQNLKEDSTHFDGKSVRLEAWNEFALIAAQCWQRKQ